MKANPSGRSVSKIYGRSYSTRKAQAKGGRKSGHRHQQTTRTRNGSTFEPFGNEIDVSEAVGIQKPLKMCAKSIEVQLKMRPFGLELQ